MLWDGMNFVLSLGWDRMVFLKFWDENEVWDEMRFSKVLGWDETEIS